MKNALRIVIVVFITSTLIRLFIIDSFFVAGDSMAPALQDGDYIFINKLAFQGNHKPQRGDVVVFAASKTENKNIVKRIIGLPYERIAIDHGSVRIKTSRDDAGETLVETYTALPETPAIGITYINLDPQEYFVLGDNRHISIDSRTLGPINDWEIKGKVIGALNISSLKFSSIK